MSPDLRCLLQHATLLYLTTYNRQGRSGTVPIWFFPHQEALYFCTRHDSLKVRRIRQTARATVHIGRRHGPQLHCTAQVLEHTPELQMLLLRTYRARYRWRWLLIGLRLRWAFARGAEVIVQLRPLPPGAAPESAPCS